MGYKKNEFCYEIDTLLTLTLKLDVKQLDLTCYK